MATREKNSYIFAIFYAYAYAYNSITNNYTKTDKYPRSVLEISILTVNVTIEDALYFVSSRNYYDCEAHTLRHLWEALANAHA